MHREIVQVCGCAFDGLLQLASLLGGVRTPLLSLFRSFCSLVHSPRSRRHCFVWSVGLLEKVKKIS